MFEFLNMIFVKVNELSQSNQAIALAISAYGLGTLGYFTRNVPSAIYEFIKHNTVVSFTVTNEGTAVNVYNLAIKNICSLKLFNISRSYGVPVLEYWDHVTDFLNNPKLVYAGGKQYFFYKGRLFWLSIENMTVQGRNISKTTLEIHTFGRSEKCIEELTKFIFTNHEEKKYEQGYKVYSYKDCWDSTNVYKTRNVESVITNGNIVEHIIEQIKEFEKSRDWYVQNGFNYKLVIMLHGPTGTGKSSIIKAVASYFNKNIFTGSISLAAVEGMEYFRKIDKGGICLFEDFDTEGISNKRDNVETEEPTTDTSTKKKDDDDLKKLTQRLLGQLFNALDGVDSVEDMIIFMTTNCYDDVDPALKRPGRVDIDYYVGYLDDNDVRRYIKYYYRNHPHVIPDGIVFNKVPGCVLYETFRLHKNDPQAFIDVLEKTPI